MEFVKKNWAKMAIVALLLLALVYVAMQFFNNMSLTANLTKAAKDAMDKKDFNSLVGMVLISAGAVVGIIGMITYAVLKMLGINKIGAYVLLGAGAVATILIVVGIILSGPALADMAKDLANMKKDASYKAAIKAGGDIAKTAKYGYATANMFYLVQVVPTVVYLVAFALVPVVKGVKKAFFSTEA